MKQNTTPFEIETVFGLMEIREPVLYDLIHSKAFQRLDYINQFGITYILNRKYKYTRYGHSLGVLHLLQKADASLNEQIAGLLHDVSHTVFSHLADIIFEHKGFKSSYQDDIHEWYILQTDIPEILKKHGFDIKDILHKEGDFPALECDLPDICADRIEYLLHQAVKDEIITTNELESILQNLHFKGRSWFFSCPEYARKLGNISLQLTDSHFSAPWNIAGYKFGAAAILKAVEKGVISKNEIHFSIDELVWQKLTESRDSEVKELINKLIHSQNYYEIGTKEKHSFHARPKFRGVDPFIKTESELKRLSEVDPEYKKEFGKLKDKIYRGIYLTLR